MNKYLVKVNFLHKPTFEIEVTALNECQARMKAVELSPYPSNTMYRNDSKVVLL